MGDTSQRIKRILIVRTDRLGDVILTLPMLPVLRKCFPGAYIAMLLRRYTGEIIEGNPYVDELLWYDKGENLIPFDSMCRTIRQRRFDAAIVVYPRLRLAWLMFRSGIPLRIGTGYRYYSFLFTKRVYEHRKDAKKHEVEYNLNLLNELGRKTPELNKPPEFFVDIPDDAKSNVSRLLHLRGIASDEELVIVHPGSGGSAREWSTDSFGMLAARFCVEKGAKVIVTGGPGEEKKGAQVVTASGGRAVSLAGELGIKELGALIGMAGLFISNSTGPLHLAVAMGTPVVGLYPQATPMSARRWGPYTEEKAVLVPNKPVDCRDCIGNEAGACACMASISVQQVYDAACELLARRRLRKNVTHA
ncbi:MAG: glycosyltransferase family 9 protein [Ignavibacteriae bacterium]|nr:glycosyltransferase family 9 protein [Ignavibacteriota bacterium]